MNHSAVATWVHGLALLLGCAVYACAGVGYAQAQAAPPAGAHDDWQVFDAQTHAASGAVPPPSVLLPHGAQPVEEEGRRWLQAAEMRSASAVAPTLQLTLTGLTATITAGAIVPAVLFAAGAGPCHLASCRDLEMQLWVAGGVAVAFAILTEELLRPLAQTQSYRSELLGDADALTRLLTISQPGAHYDNPRQAQIARTVQDLDLLLRRREQYTVEPPSFFTGIAAGAALVFGTYAVLFAATADTARPRTTEIQVFSIASAVSLGAAISGFVWLQNTRSTREELSQHIERKTSELRQLLPDAPPLSP
ncbi:MAG TPA: hypothetical protein VF331_16455 [Polyangiales bacterium]